MKQIEKAGIVCCSNGLDAGRKEEVDEVMQILTQMGITPVISEHIYAKGDLFSGTGKERARI